ncbi:MAG: hypothetical protein H8E57_10275 [Candidatus Cloacimonetes bacterium]|nr:hypothetical protein [Candidatus Cloacimonadota bacterium]
MHTLNIQLNDEIYLKLQESEKILHKSKTELLREIIENWIHKMERESEQKNIIGIWGDRFDDEVSSEGIQRNWRENKWKRF